MSQAESLDRVFTGEQPTAAAHSLALAQEQANTQSIQIYAGELLAII